MKRDIERYTDIMTTEVVEKIGIPDVKKKKKKKKMEHENPSNDKDKEGKLRERIQQLLRSQWESRLQLVDSKSDPPLQR